MDPPPHTHKQTGPITIHCAAASAQCNYSTISILLLFLVEGNVQSIRITNCLSCRELGSCKLGLHELVALPDACWHNDTDSQHRYPPVFCTHMTSAAAAAAVTSMTVGNWLLRVITPSTAVNGIKLFLFLFSRPYRRTHLLTFLLELQSAQSVCY